MKLTKQEAAAVVYWESPDWKMVGVEEIIDKSRWSYHKAAVFLYLPSGEHYRFAWSAPATESQDQDPFYEDYEPVKVELKEVTTKQWVPVEVVR